MPITTDFPYDVDIVDHVWIPLPDGTRLSAKLWRPRGAGAVPVLLEYLPYRKDDFTYWRDSIQHGYFAGHGYATARVDIRGTGDSDGILEDEYLQSEIDDAVAVIEWLAGQQWCDGTVGMFGISWGGFNSLQVAAMAPPQLKAVIAVAATADRYHTDVHYHGGAVLACEMLPWASTMLARNALPPTPSSVGGDWRQQWRDRLEKTPRYIETWLSHQRRDDYWKHGSIGEDYSAIECPVYIVGGLADGYGDTVLKVAEGLGHRSRALLGPWAHNFPELGDPGPNIGFLQEALKWWDHWLRGVDGEFDEDRVRIWIQDWVAPATERRLRPGRWVTEPSWPPPAGRLETQRLWIGAHGLTPERAQTGSFTIAGDQNHGTFGGRWWGYAKEGDLPDDQQLEAAGATSFESAPVADTMDLVGYPEVTMKLVPTAAAANVAVQLSDVDPDGRALLVARGVLNLTHRSSHEAPGPLHPGQPVTVTVQMGVAAHHIEPGHRWRLTVAGTYWPLVWPSAAGGSLELIAAPETCLSLPIRPRRAGDDAVPPFGPADHAAADVTVRREPSRRRTVEHTGNMTTIIDTDDSGEFEIPHRTVASMGGRDVFTISHCDPLSAHVTCLRDIEMAWHDVAVQVTTRSEMWASADTWHVSNTIEVRADDESIFDGEWEFQVPRDFT